MTKQIINMPAAVNALSLHLEREAAARRFGRLYGWQYVPIQITAEELRENRKARNPYRTMCRPSFSHTGADHAYTFRKNGKYVAVACNNYPGQWNTARRFAEEHGLTVHRANVASWYAPICEVVVFMSAKSAEQLEPVGSLGGCRAD